MITNNRDLFFPLRESGKPRVKIQAAEVAGDGQAPSAQERLTVFSQGRRDRRSQPAQPLLQAHQSFDENCIWPI